MHLRIDGQASAGGVIFDADDLSALLQQGHELGCHTFDTLMRGKQSRVRLKSRSLRIGMH